MFLGFSASVFGGGAFRSENSSYLKQKAATGQCNRCIFFCGGGKGLAVEQGVPVCSAVSPRFICTNTVLERQKGKEFEKLSQYLYNGSFVTQKVACTHQKIVGILYALLQLVRLTLPLRVLLVLAAVQDRVIPQKCEVKNRQIEKQDGGLQIEYV